MKPITSKSKFRLCVTSNNNLASVFRFRQEIKFLHLWNLAKNVSVFWGAIQQSKKKLHTQKKQGSQLKQQILKNFRFCSLQFVCYTKTFFSQTKNSLSFLFFRKRDDFTWMHQTAPKETVEGL